MNWAMRLATALTVLLFANHRADACSLANFVSEMPPAPAAREGSWPLLVGGSDAEMLDANGQAVAMEVVAQTMAFARTYERATAWRPVSALPAGQYTWRSHLPDDEDHAFTVDPALDVVASLTAADATVAFRTWGGGMCESLGRLDALDITLSGENITGALVELSDEAGTTRFAIVTGTLEVWSDADRDVGGPRTDKRSVSVLLRQDPVYWNAATVCAKVYAFHPPGPLSAPIDVGCHSAVIPDEPLPNEPDGSELSEPNGSEGTELVAEPSPASDDAGCGAGGSSLAALGVVLVVLRRRS